MSTMSRSTKLAIVKDKGLKKLYWKIVRRRINQTVKRFLKEDPDDIVLPHPRECINDYDYSDYTIDYEFDRSSGYFWYNNKQGSQEHIKNTNKMKRK